MLLKNQLKLVIWDLDETFWAGTLTEEGIQPIAQHIQWLDLLSTRGIVNTICSKNDPELVQQKLVELGVCEHFVFNQVAFLPKGEMIRQQLSAMQLRAENALFVDDRVANLEEAGYVNPGLMTITPDQLAIALSEPNAQGRPDPERRRLLQYRKLEERWQAMNNSDLDNDDFLRQSDIRVIISKDWENELDRIVEILHRTNQLNFTKLRSTEDEVRQQLRERCTDFGLIKVVDRYADYGWVGYYALEGDRLLHFSFSCRIMNMGVESWFYEQLGRPKLDIAEPVAADPRTNTKTIDWIKVVDKNVVVNQKTGKVSKGVVRGSCNMDQIIPYLAGDVQFEKEFNYPGASGVEIQRQLMCWLVLGKDELGSRLRLTLENLPVFEPEVLNSSIGADTDIIILSPVMDLMLGYYSHKETGALVALSPYESDITSEAYLAKCLKENSSIYSAAFLDWFRDEFKYVGRLPDEWYLLQLDKMLDQWSPSAQLILLLPNDQDMGNPQYTKTARHLQRYNELLRGWAGSRDRVAAIDFSSLVSSEEDLTYNAIYLYNRKAYFRMAQEILAVLKKIQGESGTIKISILKYYLSRLPYIRRYIARFFCRLMRALEKRWSRIFGANGT